VREGPRRQADGTHEGLEVPRRQANDEPLCFSGGDARETFGKKLEVSVVTEGSYPCLGLRTPSSRRRGIRSLSVLPFLIHNHYSLEELLVASVLLWRLVERRANA
jgi:hypothetical protein